MKASVVSDIGARFEMEDAHFLDTNFANRGWVFGGVYDGHSGNFAAAYTAKNLSQVFLEKLITGSSPQEAFTDSYQEISGQLKNQDSGTTAVNFLIKGNQIFSANVGDARAIVISDKKVYQLTVDHRIDNLEERGRIKKMGGQIKDPYVCRGERGLMPSRTIGDEYFKPVGIIAKPFVNEYKISENDLVLLAACDGLFDVMANERVADLARRFSQPEPCLEALKNEVLYNRFGADNLTMIAVYF